MAKHRRGETLRLFVESLETRAMMSADGFGAAALPVGLEFPGAAITAALDGHHQAPASIISQLAAPPTLNATTVPANGDVNPYGVAFVPQGITAGGKLHAGDVLVSNFNGSSNLQGTGTTIVEIAPNGTQSVFFQGQPGLGLTTALGVLQRGFVLVGNVPTTDGTSATVQQGSLMILDKNGNVVANLTNSALLDGPWDLSVVDEGSQALVFVSNVLSGTVTRLDLAVPAHGNHIVVESATQIASGYMHHGDPAALEIGPTGLAFDAATGVLYVASTDDNAIYAIRNAAFRQSDAGQGHLVYQDPAHLRGPLGLVLLPDGNLITSNGDAVNGDPKQPSELIEFTPRGQFVGQIPVDSSAQGGAFGIAIQAYGDDVTFAAVDDVSNTLKVWNLEDGPHK
jgi:hypothetical protein